MWNGKIVCLCPISVSFEKFDESVNQIRDWKIVNDESDEIKIFFLFFYVVFVSQFSEFLAISSRGAVCMTVAVNMRQIKCCAA